MSKWIKITDENYEEILKKIQKRCNKRKMFESEYIYENGKLAKKYTALDLYKELHNINKCSTFILAEKHFLREKYENKSLRDLEVTVFKKYRPYMQLDLGENGCLAINKNSRIKFTWFGGFYIECRDIPELAVEYHPEIDKVRVYKYYPNFLLRIDPDIERLQRFEEL